MQTNRRYVNDELVHLLITLSAWSPNGRVYYPIQRWLHEAVGPISRPMGTADYPSWARVTWFRPESKVVIQIDGKMFRTGLMMTAGRGPYTGDLPAELREQLPLIEKMCFIPCDSNGLLGEIMEGIPEVEALPD